MVIDTKWIVVASFAAMLMAACIQPEPVVVVVTATPTPEERVDDKLAQDVASRTPTPTRAPTPLPTGTPTSTNTPTPLPTSTPAPTNTPTPQPTDAPASTSTPTPVPTDTPTSTSTPTPLPTDTPVPTFTPTPVPTSTPIPTSTPTPTSTPIPTSTPVPVVKLVLNAESAVVGYWSDGTADVEVTATLRNDGTLRLDGAQDITATCIAEGDERRACREELPLSLPDGFAPASSSFTLRLPMGATTLKFDYGASAPLTFDVEVPERILGVDREVWECYADRPPEGFALGAHNDWTAGCGGWGKPTVERWLNDVPVKVWATGDPVYIEVFETVLVELAPILNMEFEWVGSEEEADFKAYVGVTSSPYLGFVDDGHAWGFASWFATGGEATSGYIVMWYGYAEREKKPDPIDSIRRVTIHEALHALASMHHNTRPTSIMGGFNTLSPRDRQLIDLNSHPLVRPGMSMEDVRKVIVLTDELLDYPEVDPYASYDDPLGLVWRAYVALEEAGSASFRLSGGWIDRGCNQTFGVRRGPIEMSIGDFEVLGDDPALVYLNIHPRQFYIVYSPDDVKWLHWQLSPGGDWEKVDREPVADASSYWLWNGKLHRAIRSVLMDGSPENISVDESPDGHLRLQVTLDHSYVNMWDWTGRDSLDLALVLDPETYALVGYNWELHRTPDANPDACLTYKEVATDGRLGVDIDDLLDDPRIESDGTPDDPLGLVWRAYVALEQAGSASFRLSGGWTDRGCNQTFGVRRGPIEMSIGDFEVLGDDPALVYLNIHPRQFYIVYSPKDVKWLHWQLSPGGDWEKVDREPVADASSYWLWNGKLHRAILTVLKDGLPEDISVDETSDGNLRLQVTLDESYVDLWEWGPIDKALDLTLVIDPDTFALAGYTWELHRNPEVHSGPCLTYKEVATDGHIGIPIEIPESIRNQLNASP